VVPVNWGGVAVGGIVGRSGEVRERFRYGHLTGWTAFDPISVDIARAFREPAGRQLLVPFSGELGLVGPLNISPVTCNYPATSGAVYTRFHTRTYRNS